MEIITCRREGCGVPVKAEGGGCWRHEYAPLVAVTKDACPWCDGTGQYARAHYANSTRVEWVPCGYCKATGKREVWTTHPEYQRLHAAPPAAVAKPRKRGREVASA